MKDSRIAPPEVHAPAKEPCCSKGARRRTHNRHRLVATTLHLNLLKMAQIRRSSRRLRRACVRGYLPPRRFSRAGARSHHELTHCARRPLALAARRPIVRAFRGYPHRREVRRTSRTRECGLRRGGRVVEGARLESVYAGNRIAGSNPAPSATASSSKILRRLSSAPRPVFSKPPDFANFVQNL